MADLLKSYENQDTPNCSKTLKKSQLHNTPQNVMGLLSWASGTE